MQPSEWLTLLNILIAFLGVLIVGFTIFEWRSLRVLRADLQKMRTATQKEIEQSLKAAHRVIASYQLKEPDARISLLESALKTYPNTYNGYNTLGYAYWEKGDMPQAIDAFHKAILRHPDDKAGYCDLAAAYLQSGNVDLCVKYCREAIRVDPSAEEDIIEDQRFASVLKRIL